MKLGVEYAGLTDIGKVRTANEDAWVADPELGLYAVSDGMGGEAHGSLASNAVVKVLPALIQTKRAELSDLALPETAKVVSDIVADISRRVSSQAAGEPGLDGMGATLVLALVRHGRALIAHMGDSRAYLYRDGALQRLTKDHTLVQLLMDAGDLDADGASKHPARGKLTRFVGMSGRPLPETRSLDVRPGDRLLLCSDGLSNMVSDDGLVSIFKESDGDQDACERFIASANEAGGRDNTTVVVLAFQPTESEEPPS